METETTEANMEILHSELSLHKQKLFWSNKCYTAPEQVCVLQSCMFTCLRVRIQVYDGLSSSVSVRGFVGLCVPGRRYFKMCSVGGVSV